MIWKVIKKFIQRRQARAMYRSRRNKGIFASFIEVLQSVIDDEVDKLYREDLYNCFAKNPSVIKRAEYIEVHGKPVFIHWEMYFSNTKNVYVYLPDSGERRIHKY